MTVSYRPVWATNKTKHQLFQEKRDHARPSLPVQSLWTLPSFADSAPLTPSPLRALPLFPWLLLFPFFPFSA